MEELKDYIILYAYIYTNTKDVRLTLQFITRNKIKLEVQEKKIISCRLIGMGLVRQIRDFIPAIYTKFSPNF